MHCASVAYGIIQANFSQMFFSGVQIGFNAYMFYQCLVCLDKESELTPLLVVFKIFFVFNTQCSMITIPRSVKYKGISRAHFFFPFS